MQMRVRGFLVVMTLGGLIACGAPETGDARPSSADMRWALDCTNCPSPHRIEQENDPSGCGVGETCNPPGAGGGNISCVDGSTSHDGNTCDAVLLTAD
jgi:hypothetical protein